MHYYDKYVVTKRFEGKTVSGELNLPYGTECHTITENGSRVIICDKGVVCYVGSYVALNHFSQNDDGDGFERGRLTHSITKRLESKKNHQDRWNKVWNDPVCQKYKNRDFTNHWLWNYDFYNAPLTDLNYIAELVGAK